jgi:hypothetical protein
MAPPSAALRPYVWSFGMTTVATMKFGPVISLTGQTAPEAKTRGTFTAVKRAAVWKIAHFRNTIVDPDAEKDDPITWDETGFLPGRTR